MNTTTAAFKPGSRRATVSPSLAQYDYGQILIIQDLNLPASFEVHFSNRQLDGESKTSIGSDGRVEIPDEYLESGEDIYAFIYLHATESDGETEYRILIPVDKRPKPTHEELTPVQQSEAEQLIAALEGGVDRATSAADRAEDALWALHGTNLEARTVPYGTDPEVTKEINPNTGAVTMIFDIPEGAQGVKGDKGDRGDGGPVFYPSVSIDGYLSWTNDAGLENPEPVDMVTTIINALPLAEGVRF